MSHHELGVPRPPLFKTILGDMWFRIPAIRIAEGQVKRAGANTFMYLFEWESPLIGAAHALDLMMFGNGLPLPGLALMADFEKTAETMRSAWVNFASSGEPSTTELEWPSYCENRATMSLGENSELLLDPYKDELSLFEQVIQRSWGNSDL